MSGKDERMELGLDDQMELSRDGQIKLNMNDVIRMSMNDQMELTKDDQNKLRTDDFQCKLRNYQLKIIREAEDKNVLVFLPTGSGKTFIAVQIIRSKSHEVIKSLNEGGKRSFFVVYTKALVDQQAAVMRENTSLKIGTYTGDMNVDFWSAKIWRKELNENNILVMTADILVILLEKCFITIPQINLIIFDECHHATGKSSYCVIMNKFAPFSPSECPRVIGLSATMFNKNVKPHQVDSAVATLEGVFNAKIVTADEMKDIMDFIADPDVKIVEYCDIYVTRELQAVFMLIEISVDKLRLLQFPSDNQQQPTISPDNAKLEKKCNARRKVCNNLADIRDQIINFGLMGGYISTLYHIIFLEKLRYQVDDSMEEGLYSFALNTTLRLRRMLLYMTCDLPLNETFSNKLYLLMETLKEYNNRLSNRLKVIIFVEKRTSTIVLYHAIKRLQANESSLNFIKHDYICGGQGNPLKDTLEVQLEGKKQRMVLDRFRKNELNVMIATQVLEEGIDIQECNLVIRLDKTNDYRTYVQSKGRARQKDGVFVVFSMRPTETENNIKDYDNTEKCLKELLITRSGEGFDPIEISQDDIEYFYANGPNSSHVCSLTAIRVLFRYCAKLPQDLYSSLTPIVWYRHNYGRKKVQCILQLPTSSPLKKDICSGWFPSKKEAKRSASLITCQELFEIGELDDKLEPKSLSVENLSSIDKKALFPHWINESDMKFSPGSKKRKQIYKLASSSSDCLTDCRPQLYTETYLHIILFQPQFESSSSSNRRRVFHKLISCNERTFAMVTTKIIPPLPKYPLFLSQGEVTCQLVRNQRIPCLRQDELELLERFHFSLFANVLSLLDSLTFVLFDRSRQHGFLVAPVRRINGRYDIDWECIEQESSLELKKKPSVDALSVISPIHRDLSPKQFYVITEMSEHMSPESPFPNFNYKSFAHYFDVKYDKKIKDKNQPMAEVKQLSSKINFIRPRKAVSGGIKSMRKEREAADETEEHLIPELCEAYTFPAGLWIKALMLPCAFYKMNHMLIVDDFRRKLVKETGLGTLDVTHWEPLTLNEIDIQVEEESISPTVFIPPPTKMSPSKKNSFDKDPIDIERNLEQVSPCDLGYYVKYVNQSAVKVPRPKLYSPSSSPNKLSRCPDIKLLLKTLTTGPELHQLLSVFTTNSANDIVNMERLETLGDSFLKFAVSLFLFRKYDSHEGFLTTLKGQLLGNRNLLYCGQHKDMPRVIKVRDIDPKHDWLPPAFYVPSCVQERILNDQVNSYTLLQANHSKQEQFNGEFIAKKWAALDYESDENYLDNTLDAFLSVNVVTDKAVADCVEALLGLYVSECGLSSGIKILNWLQVLPELDEGQNLLQTICPSPVELVNSSKIDTILRTVNIKALETILGYKFRNYGFLLEALTHPSFTTNRITCSYQRLEFLGDSILDFLITAFIYENCSNFTPGQITDLRSSLVNNITFACLAVRHEFHKFLLSHSSSLMRAILNFVQLQESKGYIVDDSTLVLLEEHNGFRIAESLTIPKALGDVFESIAGAIFLDSDNSLSTVWRVYHRLMENEINAFMKNIPKPPIRQLYELSKSKPLWTSTSEKGITQVCCEVKVRGKIETFYGFAHNKKEAKQTAAKLAVLRLKPLLASNIC